MENCRPEGAPAYVVLQSNVQTDPIVAIPLERGSAAAKGPMNTIARGRHTITPSWRTTTRFTPTDGRPAKPARPNAARNAVSELPILVRLYSAAAARLPARQR